jgi:hypothetical protein
MIPWKCTHNAEMGNKCEGAECRKNLQILDGCPRWLRCDLIVSSTSLGASSAFRKTTLENEKDADRVDAMQLEVESDVVKTRRCGESARSALQ